MRKQQFWEDVCEKYALAPIEQDVNAEEGTLAHWRAAIVEGTTVHNQSKNAALVAVPVAFALLKPNFQWKEADADVTADPCLLLRRLFPEILKRVKDSPFGRQVGACGYRLVADVVRHKKPAIDL